MSYLRLGLPFLLPLAIFCLFVPRGEAVPIVYSIKRDLLLVDVDGDGLVDQGDTLRYNIYITNTGTTNATGVILEDTIDGNSTLVPGTFRTTPLARNDVYPATINITLTVTAANGLVVNDDDPDGTGPVTVHSLPYGNITANGGTVSVSADGSFTYNPPAGFTGVDSFVYVIADSDGNQDPAQVFLVVTSESLTVNPGRSLNGDGAIGDGAKGDQDGTLAPQSGETVTVTLGIMNAGQVVRIRFDATIDTAQQPPTYVQVCNQGLVSGDNFAGVLTDDPDVGGPVDPTCTVLQLLLVGTLLPPSTAHLDWSDGYANYELWRSTQPYSGYGHLADYTVSEADVPVNVLQNYYYYVVGIGFSSENQSNSVGVITFNIASGQ